MTFENIFADYDTSKYQVPGAQDNNVRIVLGVVRRIKHWKQKNGKPMMFFTLECPDGTQHDMVMFNSVYVPIDTNKIYRMSVVGNKFRSII